MSFLNFVIEDGNGEKSSIPLDFSGIFTGDLNALVENAWAILNPLLSGKLVNASMTLEADISGLVNDAAGVLSDVQEKAETVFASIDGFLKTISLPTIVETKLTNAGAGNELNLTDTDVAAFVAMCTDGVNDGATTTGHEVKFTTSHGEDLFSLKKTRQAWGKNRK